jgi:hypothetical protein
MLKFLLGPFQLIVVSDGCARRLQIDFSLNAFCPSDIRWTRRIACKLKMSVDYQQENNIFQSPVGFGLFFSEMNFLFNDSLSRLSSAVASPELY